MKRLATLLLLALLPIVATGQIRTGSDIESGNFAFGIDNYLLVSAASGGKAAFDFSTCGKAFKVIAEDGCVSVGETVLLEKYRPVLKVDKPLGIPAFAGKPDMVIGIHDFTSNRNPELVIALRDPLAGGLVAYVYGYEKDCWKALGEIAAFGPEIYDCRIFRQAITVEDGENLHTWTYRGGKFVFRSSNGSKDPSSLLSR